MISFEAEKYKIKTALIFFDKFNGKKKSYSFNKKPMRGNTINFRIKSSDKLIKYVNQKSKSLHKRQLSPIKDHKRLSFYKKRQPKIFLQSNEKAKLNLFTIQSNSFFGLKNLTNKKQMCFWDSSKVQLLSQDKQKLNYEAKKIKLFNSLDLLKNKIQYNFSIMEIPIQYHSSTFLPLKQNKENKHKIFSCLTNFSIVHINTLKFIEDEVHQCYHTIQYHNFLRKYRIILNDFTTNPNDNLFFCIIKMQNKLIQYFFWIGAPILGFNRQQLIDNVKHFFLMILAEKQDYQIFQKINQGKKIMLIDWKGRVSYLQQKRIFNFQQKQKIKDQIKRRQRKTNLTLFLKTDSLLLN